MLEIKLSDWLAWLAWLRLLDLQGSGVVTDLKIEPTKTPFTTLQPMLKYILCCVSCLGRVLLLYEISMNESGDEEACLPCA
jgi:hypothetical protein